MKTKTLTRANLREHAEALWFALPALLLVGLFAYYPAMTAVLNSFYDWDGSDARAFVGLGNYRNLLGPLGLWGCLLLAGGLALSGALAESERWRRWLLRLGILDLVCLATLLALDWRTLPRGTSLAPLWPWLAGLAACCLWLWLRPRHWRRGVRVAAWGCALATGTTYLIGVRHSGDILLWSSFQLIFILIAANLLKMWPSIITAVCIHRLTSARTQYLYRVLFVIPMIIPQMVMLLIWKFFYDPNVGPLNQILTSSGAHHVLVWLDQWVFHSGAFHYPFKPIWLGDPALIVPALIFWGFPWVGVVGVLIYLAGLQNISQSVYEAADLDGIGAVGKFFRIELPLIMTQVRLNLIMMIIGTFQAYGFQLVLLGMDGGPGNKGMTPGLYMFYQGFANQNYGYACALGLALFAIILVLTILNNRFVRVEK